MKNLVLILMATMIAGGGYILKIKSEESLTLTVDLRKKDETLSLLQARLKSLDDKVTSDEARLATDQKQLVGQAQQAQAQATRLMQDLTTAQNALARETAHKQAIRDQQSALRLAKQSVGDPSLAGHIQNDQTRLKEVERQLKVVEESEKNRKLATKDEAKADQEQMKVQENSVQQQLAIVRTQVKALQNQLSAKRKEKYNFNRVEEVAQIQHLIDAANSTIAQMNESIQQLHQKEVSDNQSISYQGQQAASDAGDSKSSLVRERIQLQGDLANLTSRNGLVKRDGAEIAGQLNALGFQEHDADVKIQALNQTVQRLKAEIAARPKL